MPALHKGPGNVVGSASRRIVQGFGYLAPKRSSAIDDELRALLTAAEFDLVARLSVSDRAHLLSVYRRLVRSGHRDADLLKAALLHDVGKVADGCHVGLVHRTIAVLLNGISPSILARLATSKGRHWRRAFQLVLDHPARGAQLVRDAGSSERVCWLIEHHHDASMGNDADLLALHIADEGRSG